MRKIYKRNETIFPLSAKTFQGLEKVLTSEIKKIGGRDIRTGQRVVHFKGDLEVMYKANYLVRTAINILWEIHHFKASDSQSLYEQALCVPWDEYISLDQTFSIDRTVHSSTHTHSQFAALKIKDAIADYFVNKYNKRPNVDTNSPDVKIHLHISNENCRLSVDTSGDALFKRNYRKQTGAAPLNEILASGIIMLSDYKDIEYFYDPMCGSGTLLIEAAQIFMNIPPGYYRQHFGFINFQNYDYRLWHKIKRDADKNINKEIPLRIFGTDIDAEVVDLAKKNIRSAGLNRHIRILEKDFTETNYGQEKKGIIITNPPYDRRIQSKDIFDLYRKIGETLKKNYAGWRVYIFSGNIPALKKISLKSEQNLTLFNGKISCRLAKYTIFKQNFVQSAKKDTFGAKK